jgi:hypothetical protein
LGRDFPHLNTLTSAENLLKHFGDGAIMAPSPQGDETMSISYRIIDTYSNDSGNLGTNWFGPQSDVAFQAPGTSTPWGSNFAVSSFDVGASIGSGSTDVLNTGNFGSDELNLSALLAATQYDYSVSNAPVFNWGSGETGFGCDSLSVSGGIYSDTLSASDWGLVRDYEMSLTTTLTAGPGIGVVSVSNFQNTNLQSVGATPMVSALNVQSGTFDFSRSLGEILRIATASDATQGSTQTYAVLAGQDGGYVQFINGTQATDFAGNALVTDGHTSLLDFYDNGGGNIINLTASNINSNIFLNGSAGGMATHGGGSLSFISTNGQSGFGATGGGDLINLNAHGSGAADIVTNDTSGGAWVNNFVLGRDTLDVTLTGGDFYSIGGPVVNGQQATVITGANDTSGVVLAGVSPFDVSAHVSTSIIGGAEHLFIH